MLHLEVRPQPLWCLCLALAYAACVGPPIGSDRHAVKEEPAAEVWRRAAMDAPNSAYRTVPGLEKLDSHVRGDSLYWSDRFFVPRAHPFHQTGELQISAQPAKKTTPDLVRYQYRVDKLELTVVESSNFTFVWVAGSGVAEEPEASRPALVARVAASILNTKNGEHDWVFGSMEPRGKDLCFSTNPQLDAWDLRSWQDRADGGIHGGLLYFLLFKKNAERVGYHRGEHWFDDSFRSGLGLW